MSQGLRAAPKRKSGQGSHSPPSQHRLPVKTGPVVSVSPFSSPPVGGATTPLVAEVVHDRTLKEQPTAVRSAGSLGDRRPLTAVAAKTDKAPPTPRGKTPRVYPKKTTPRLSPRTSWVNGPGPFRKDEEEKRRRPEVKEDPTMRRSASGSHMEGLSLDARPGGATVAGYPVVQPPTGYPARCQMSVSGSTTPTEGEGVPFTLLSRLRNNPVLQVQDSRIMRLIGRRSVLKSNGEVQTVRNSKALNGRQTPMADDGEVENKVAFQGEEESPRRPDAELVEVPEPLPEPERDTPNREKPGEKIEDVTEVNGKVSSQDSPRNHLDDGLDGPIVWPGSKMSEDPKSFPSEPAVPVERQRPQEDVCQSAPAAEEVPIYAPLGAPGPEVVAEMPLLQNEAGSLVVPQTWRFVPPPPEQAPKPCYDKVEAKAGTSTATPPREDATPTASKEDLTPKKLIEDLVQDQVKLDLRDKQQLVEQLVECLIDQVKRYEKELGAEQRANRALKMSLEVEQRKALMYHQRLSELAQVTFKEDAAAHTLEPEL